MRKKNTPHEIIIFIPIEQQVTDIIKLKIKKLLASKLGDKRGYWRGVEDAKGRFRL